MAASTRAAQTKRSAPLEWRGSVTAFDDDAQCCTVAWEPDGWVVTIHGADTNDEGARYDWTRTDEKRYAALPDALKAAARLYPRFVREHAAAEDKRRAAAAKAAKREASS